MAATMLLCDAWFDGLSSRPGSERLLAIVLASASDAQRNRGSGRGELSSDKESSRVAYDAELDHVELPEQLSVDRYR